MMTNSISPGLRTASLMAREIDGEIVVLDPVANLIHRLNSTAATIWRHCDTAASADEIAARLVAEFDVGRDVALQDVDRTLQQLRSLKLIE